MHAALPSPLIWAVLLAPFATLLKHSAAWRAALVFCAWSVGVWVLTSRYPRYLMASFPLLALMAALGWQVLFGWIAAAFSRLRPSRPGPAGTPGFAGRWLAVLLLAALAAVSMQQTARKVAMISPTPATTRCLPARARARLCRHATTCALHATGRVYQVALSEAIYYGPNPIWGDSLGPWRYGDFITLPPARAGAQTGQARVPGHRHARRRSRRA